MSDHFQANPFEMMPATDGRVPRLLVVTAHADDETFIFGGTLARYAAEGVAVHLVVGCLDDQDSAAVRRTELACASEALGLASTTVLDYVTPTDRGDLSEGRVEEFAARVREQILGIDPQVVVSFDSTGGTGESDHILVGRATRSAFESTVRDADGDEGARRKLYAAHFGKRLMRFGVNVLRLIPGRDPRRFGPGGVVDLVASLDASLPATTFVDVGPYLDVRRRAVLCHRSQLDGAPWFLRRYEMLPARVRGALFPREVYARVWPPAAADFREEGFFGPDGPVGYVDDAWMSHDESF